MNIKFCTEKLRQIEHRHYYIATAASAALFVACLLVYLVLVPLISRLCITRLRELRNGTESMSHWRHQSAPLFTRIYLWNLTNSDQVSRGTHNPVFTEVGPYVYEQYTEKIPMEYKENSIVYKARTVYKHRPDLTAPASLADTVVTLNAGLYGAAWVVHSMSPSMVYLVNQAAPILFPGLQSIFSSVTVGEYLFDGVPLHCADAAGTVAYMVCSLLPRYAPPTMRQRQNSSDFEYSFFAHKNNTLTGPYEEDRGLKDIHNLGQLLNVKGRSTLNTWQAGSECDKLKGTDSLTFSPFVTRDDVINIYFPDICQVVPLFFESESKMKGLQVYKFVVSDSWLDNATNNNENSCFCHDTGEQFCANNGVRDVSKCMKVPVVMSLPHFLLADEKLRAYAQGMRPDRHLHMSQLFIEPQTGTPVKAAKKVQLNMNIKRIAGFDMTKNITEGLFPILWLEEGAELPEQLLSTVKRPLTKQWTVNVVSLVLMSFSLSALGCVLLALFCVKGCSRASNRVKELFDKPPARPLPLPELTLARSLYHHSR